MPAKPPVPGAGVGARLRWVCLALGCVPGVQLAWGWAQGTLGVDPLDRLTRSTGQWAAIFLLLTLAITPLRRVSIFVARRLSVHWGRRVSDWSLLVCLRRPLGLIGFAYACGHMAIHFVLHAGAEVGPWIDELAQKRYLQVGLATVLLLLPLALTSSDLAKRRLKKRWRLLHRLVYPAAILALLHDWMQLKHGMAMPWFSTVLLALLLAARLRLTSAPREVIAAADTEPPPAEGVCQPERRVTAGDPGMGREALQTLRAETRTPSRTAAPG